MCQYKFNEYFIIYMGDNMANIKLKEARKRKGIKQDDLKKFLNVSQAQISRYENCIDQLDYDGLIKLSFLYDTSIDYLLGLTDIPKPYPRAKKKSL